MEVQKFSSRKWFHRCTPLDILGGFVLTSKQSNVNMTKVKALPPVFKGATSSCIFCHAVSLIRSLKHFQSNL